MKSQRYGLRVLIVALFTMIKCTLVSLETALPLPYINYPVANVANGGWCAHGITGTARKRLLSIERIFMTHISQTSAGACNC